MNRKEQIILGVLGLLIGACGCLAAWLVVPQFQKMFSPPPSATPMPSAIVSQPTNTLVVTSLTVTLATANVVQPTDALSPTYTPIPSPTNISIPVATSTGFVPPADGILFQDNFDKSMSPDWAVVSGTWLISKGRLTMLPGDPYTNAYSWISLNKPDWKNYNLSVNVNDTYTNIGNQFVIVVRYGSAQRIGVVVNSLADTYLALIGDGWSSNSPITDEKFNFPVNTNTNVEIEVQNDNYILRVNGRELQNITLSGFDSGGISIGLNCDSNCPSFDNVKVTYLP